MIKIEKGIPIPPRPKSGPRQGFVRQQYPFAAMDAGDSFWIKAVDHSETQLSTNLLSAAARYDGEWVTRRERGGVRIWRQS